MHNCIFVYRINIYTLYGIICKIIEVKNNIGEGMDKMLKKLKKFIVVAAAAIMLSAGFATAAPTEAQARSWSDPGIDWGLSKGYITVDMRDSLATRQDMWLIITRIKNKSRGYDYNSARRYVMSYGISDGLRGSNWITRNEAVAMIFQTKYNGAYQSGWQNSTDWGRGSGVYDGTRGNDFATRGEIMQMLWKAHVNNFI
ncbi:protein phosphatase 2C [Bacillus cereus group sp. BfR-BA-01523]|uniref:protein phosphatase 2C n=1 Tax=Bacillus cereus group sp. BfR-BA-01523 TaxID=2920371 RepID=UPI0028C471A5|nr:protein phosphatase 2C [Bacillus cereus group sp. BfR-BA-01523]